MSGKQRRNLIRILVASAMMVALHFAPVQGLLRFVLYLVPYLVVGYDILLCFLLILLKKLSCESSSSGTPLSTILPSDIKRNFGKAQYRCKFEG